MPLKKEEPAPVVDYYEQCFGAELSSGSLLRPGLVGVRFEDKPVRRYSTFLTAGLSHYVLPQDEGDPLRIELVFACHTKLVESVNPMSIIANMADMILDRHAVPPEATVIGPLQQFTPEVKMAALYLTVPRAFAALAENDLTCWPELFMPIWCVPITRLEAAFIRSHGAEAFEERVEKARANMLDLMRPELVDHA